MISTPVGDTVIAVFILTVTTLWLIMLVGWLIHCVPTLSGAQASRVASFFGKFSRAVTREDLTIPDTCWIAIDDRAHDTVPAYKVSGKK